MGIPPEMRDGITASAAVTPLWPEHQTALQIFGAVQTQWRVGMAGATGLDYTALPIVMELYQVAPADRRQVFDDVRVMEGEALRFFGEKHGR